MALVSFGPFVSGTEDYGLSPGDRCCSRLREHSSKHGRERSGRLIERMKILCGRGFLWKWGREEKGEGGME